MILNCLNSFISFKSPEYIKSVKTMLGTLVDSNLVIATEVKELRNSISNFKNESRLTLR